MSLQPTSTCDEVTSVQQVDTPDPRDSAAENPLPASAVETAAITGYSVSLNGTELEHFWANECGQPTFQSEAIAPQPSFVETLLTVFASAIEMANLDQRSWERRDIMVLLGGNAFSDGGEYARIVLARFQFISGFSCCPQSPQCDTIARLLEVSVTRTQSCRTNATIICFGEWKGSQLNMAAFVIEHPIYLRRDGVCPRAYVLAPTQPRQRMQTVGYVGFVGAEQTLIEVATTLSAELGREAVQQRCVLDAAAASATGEWTTWQFLLKAVLAVERGVFPLSSVEWAVPPPFRESRSGQPWFGVENMARTAQLSTARPGGAVTSWLLSSSKQERLEASVRTRGTEVFAFSSHTPADLADELRRCTNKIRHAPDLARCDAKPWRMALVAENASQLRELAIRSLSALERAPETAVTDKSGIFYSGAPLRSKHRLVMLFPGLGSQALNANLAALLTLPRYRDILDQWNTYNSNYVGHRSAEWMYPDLSTMTPGERKFCFDRINSPEDGGQAGFLSNLAMFHQVTELGVQADAMLGFSSGENAAMFASGTLREVGEHRAFQIMNQLSRAMQNRLSEASFPRGVTLSVTTNDAKPVFALAEEYKDRLFVALDNCPRQLILFSLPEIHREITDKLQRIGCFVLRLAFDRPAHTPLYHQVCDTSVRALYESFDIREPLFRVYSTVTAAPFPENRDAILDLMCRQWYERVRFRETVEQLHKDGLRIFLEVGSGARLSSFVADTLGRLPHITWSLSGDRTRGSVDPFWGGIGMLFAQGHLESSRLFSAAQATSPRIDVWQPPAGEPESEAFGRPAGSPIDSASRLARLNDELMMEFERTQIRINELLNGRTRSTDNRELTRTTDRDEPLASDCPGRRLLENRHQTNDRTTWTCNLNSTRDRLLLHHAYGGRISDRQPELRPLVIVPMACTIEIAFQAACKIAHRRPRAAILRNLRAHQWLTIETDQLALRVEGTPQKTSSVIEIAATIAVLQAAKDGRFKPAFETEVAFPTQPQKLTTTIAPLKITRPIRLTADDYHRFLLFHGSAFRGIKRFVSCGPEGLEAHLDVASQIPSDLPVKIIDVIGQLSAYWLHESEGLRYFGSFPTSVAQITLVQLSLPKSETLICRARLRRENDRVFGDYEVCDENGSVYIRAEQFQSKIFQFNVSYLTLLYWQRPEFFFSQGSFAHGVPGVILRRIKLADHQWLIAGGSVWPTAIAFMVLSARERALWLEIPDTGPRRVEWLMGRLAAKDAVRELLRSTSPISLFPADVEIIADPQGCPKVHCGYLGSQARCLHVSISHNGGVIMAAARFDSPIGLDFEKKRPIGSIKFLDRAYSDDELAALPVLDRLAGWTCKEAAAKACGVGLQGNPRGWRVSARSEVAGDYTVESAAGMFTVRLRELSSAWLAIAWRNSERP